MQGVYGRHPNRTAVLPRPWPTTEAEGTNTMAADMIQAKEATEAVAKEAKTEAGLKDSKEMMQGE